MGTEEDRVQMITLSEAYFESQQYQLVLNMLENFNCVAATWLKGRSCLKLAEQIASSFKYKYYLTQSLEEEYRNILKTAKAFLLETVQLLWTAREDIREQIAETIWYDLGKVDNELMRTKPIASDDIEDDDFNEYADHHVASITEELKYWSL
ncbi:uncharacterized protein LOC131670102 [Phymastichus coffea]|uniref:uncharacterized protein LOC131670102 n=1 Tax=Phymastichus coffea TaxID=108790 RepID=UPI00273C5854|nr:uncharacterized protein LOC131670102 [Phymastichus coffea]